MRVFDGFDFSKTDADFKTEVDESAKKFFIIEIISIANFLRIEIDGTDSYLAE